MFPLTRFLGRAILNRSFALQLRSSVHRNRTLSQWGPGAVSVLGTSQLGDSVHVELSTGGTQSVRTNFHNFWLRDSCRCPQCFSEASNQRLFDTSSLSTNTRPRDVSVVDHTSLLIKWEDGHCSTFSGEWLLTNSVDTVSEVPSLPRVVWGSEIRDDPPTLHYTDVMTQDRAVLDLYDNMERYGFCLVKETPVELSASEELMSHIGMVRHTFFGGFCVIEANMNKKDTAYSNLAIDLHTDGNYFQAPPGIIVFHTLKFEGPMPCLNYLVDGEKLRQTIQAESPDLYKILCNVPLSYHHWDKTNKYLNSFVPFNVDPNTDKLLELHFNNHDRLPLSKPSLDALLKINPNGTLVDIYEAIQAVIKTSKRQDIQYEIRLEPGTALILDNHRLMHARSEFKGHRVLFGTYMDKEDLLSTVMSIRENMQT